MEETTEEKLPRVLFSITSHHCGHFHKLKRCIESAVASLPPGVAKIVVYGNECFDPKVHAWCAQWPDSQVRYEHISNQALGGGLTGTWLRGVIACIKDPEVCAVVIAN